VIGWLSGSVVHTYPSGAVVVDVNGVGYEVQVASAQVYGVGEPVEFFVYTVVRADAIVLYGFATYADREFFEMLLITPGVGPSTALAALRTMSTNDLALAIESADVKRVSKIPGIGAKTASRIVLELKGKLSATGSYEVLVEAAQHSSAIDDALRGLGYSSQEVRQALENAELPQDESEALRVALQLLRRQ
jgi:Holliday junction DNA helicase RuvA